MGRLDSYYDVLGVARDSSILEIRSAYRKLALIWHPDRWARKPSFSEEAKRRFQRIQEAYEVLSDQRRRMLYDTGLYCPEEEGDEGFSEFLQEMLSLMAAVRNEKKSTSMDELRRMFAEMAQGFQFPASLNQEDCGNAKRRRCDARWKDRTEMDSSLAMSNVWNNHGCCN